jgi:hypothetical protein
MTSPFHGARDFRERPHWTSHAKACAHRPETCHISVHARRNPCLPRERPHWTSHAKACAHRPETCHSSVHARRNPCLPRERPHWTSDPRALEGLAPAQQDLAHVVGQPRGARERLLLLGPAQRQQRHRRSIARRLANTCRLSRGASLVRPPRGRAGAPHLSPADSAARRRSCSNRRAARAARQLQQRLRESAAAGRPPLQVPNASSRH